MVSDRNIGRLPASRWPIRMYLSRVTKLAARARATRGGRTRESLVTAGIALLADGGWAAVTTRAVATRAQSNPGLIHYHFGGLPGLRAAIAERASAEAIGPAVDPLLQAEDVDSAIDALDDGITRLVADDRRIRLAAELMAGARHDPAVGAAFQRNLEGARAGLEAWFADRYPHWPAERAAGTAALAAALFDGLLLHRALDETTPMSEALATLRACVSWGNDPGRHHVPTTRGAEHA